VTPVNPERFFSVMLQWRKSSYSVGNGECVEAASAYGWVAVRDSKNPAGPVLFYTARAWRYFIAAIKSLDFKVLAVPQF
jgi:Domain of unknown function (DUF397)